MVAVAVVGNAVIGAGASIYSSNQAASAQKSAANQANQTQQSEFNTVQNQLAPYTSLGNSNVDKLNNMTNTGFNFNPDMATLQNTPGYQFNLYQGENAVQNSMAAKGLANSGNALRGSADYASGLAANTFQQQYGNALSSYQTNLAGLQTNVNIGENAAAGVGNAALSTGNQISANQVGVGNAQAAAYTQQGNAVSSAANAYSNYAMLQPLLQGSNTGNYYGNQNPNPMSSFDQSAAGNGLPWSDARLKENIELLGEENGWPVYAFNYIGDKVRYVGVMAQDIIKFLPRAVVRIGDYMAVDYSQLNVTFRRL